MTMHDENKNGTARILELDGLRGVAVLMVFLSHAFRSQLLWSGVDLFFILSGFLITGILVEQRGRTTLSRYLASFYQRRARRILPPYLVLLGLTSIIFGIGWMRHWYLFVFLMNTASFLEVGRHYSLAVLWSLAVEEQFYLLWPFAVYLLSETALSWLAGCLVVTAPLLRWIATAYFPGHWQVYLSLPFRMDLLAAGALLALVWRRRRAAIERFGGYGLVLACLAAIPLVLFSRYPWFQPAADSILVNVWLYEIILFGYVSVLVWALSGRVVGILKLRPLVYVGRISYTLYLVHTTVITVVRNHLHRHSAGTVIALAISLLFAAVSWRYLESPILSRVPSARTSPAIPPT
jgi:peptidoglycan/LPS O-acetylase OafA/YrhL